VIVDVIVRRPAVEDCLVGFEVAPRLCSDEKGRPTALELVQVQPGDARMFAKVEVESVE
jgi:hypothetical protein